MAYEKQEWKCGDTVTAEKLNHIEEGIANSGGALVLKTVRTEKVDNCTYHYTGHTLQEVIDALQSGTPVVAVSDGNGDLPTLAYVSRIERVLQTDADAGIGAYRILGTLALSTNNAAETATGYATLYADSLDDEVHEKSCYS